MRSPLLISSLFLCFLPSCHQEEEAPAAPQRPPAVVQFVHPVQKEITAWDEYTGRLEAVNEVEVRARVSGLLERVNFTDGQLVEEGDLLFTIDREPFEAELAAAQADLAQAETERDLARSNYQRGQALLERNAIAAEDVEVRKGTFAGAEARVQAQRARVRIAQLNLEYTEVRSPITGRTADRFVSAGNLISGGTAQSTLLTTIVTVDPIYCRIEADEASVLKYMRLNLAGKRESAREGGLEIQMGLGDDEGFPRVGRIDFVNNAFDTGTATMRARAVFDNDDGFLTPGMFARVRLPGRGEYTAMLVPEIAVQTQQSFTSLLTVGEGEVVEVTPVTLGPLQGEMRVVEGELDTETRVIVSGITQARPGAPVQAERAPAESGEAESH
ncbi:efflux RND transporter periplasmic adaptor subunit [Roseibacillus ishigakijimensis]|uniref:Efflux RND transporter periplasmic adaptor subunit n=1 Tax=Roseibacillus ishigakijimensis TaxID=454146 RepID=A0A934VLP1_9BACT|nr:efflux RND transporter periplasmic adaptor subunit [Roseibacillus ishigakijimensis]MBK1834889.1 efflux RND transporter periplasmic adaptor subunit [Roseibacillus ishigakijimensis]